MSLKPLKDFKDKKRELKILILGPYRPPPALQRLETLRDCLINRKFNQVKLAKDFPDEIEYNEDLDIYFTKKSYRLIEEWAHVPVFIFLKNGDNTGVTSELIHLCESVKTKVPYALVLVERKLKLSSLISGPIKIQKISSESFKDDEELCNLAYGHCINALYRLYYYI